MIPLIPDISNSDAERYYSGTVVFMREKDETLSAYIFQAKEGNTAHVQDRSGSTLRKDYSRLLRMILPPFYTERGEYVGLNVQRSTRRGHSYSNRLLPDLLSLAETGDVQPIGNRLNRDFFIKEFRGINTLEYRGLPVGVFNAEKTILWVQDEQIKERFLKYVRSTNDELIIRVP